MDEPVLIVDIIKAFQFVCIYCIYFHISVSELPSQTDTEMKTKLSSEKGVNTTKLKPFKKN